MEVVFARGTFEAPGVGATGQAFVDALNARLPGKTVDVYAVNYPASLDFGQAADGIVDASNKIETIAASCPNTKIVLGGYSQGAAVAGYTTTDTVPAGFALPAGITGPMPACGRPARRGSGPVRYTGCLVPELGSTTAHHPSPSASSTPLRPFNCVQPVTPSASLVALTGPRTVRTRSNGMADQAADFAARQLGAPPQRRRCSRPQVRLAPASAPTSRLRHLRPSLTRR